MTTNGASLRVAVSRSNKVWVAILLIAAMISICSLNGTNFQSVLPPTRLQSSTNGLVPLLRSKLPASLSVSYKRACRKLIENPRELIRCRRDRENGWSEPECENGTMTFQSQFSQDYYLYVNHFRFLSRPGVYLDVAANEPIRISNTWVLDACLGWTGVCVEANPVYVERLQLARTCYLIPTCVGDTDGQNVSFILGKGMSGIDETNKNLHRVNESNAILLQCTTLKSELKDMDVQRVDYFSLDVEGHEIYVLRGIDWNKLSFNVITVEVTDDSIDEIEAFLTSKGYVRHAPKLSQQTKRKGLLHMDAVFLHPDVVFGNPV